MAEQRRHFSRIAFKGEAFLVQDGRSRPCHLLDISLKGALIELAGGDTHSGQACELKLDLGEDAVLSMHGHVAHHEGMRLGIVCEDIDLDSMTHLRRLIELNLGDSSLAERELAALIGD